MWSSIEEKIMFYNELSPEEQRDVEQHVREHPELAPLLDEAQAFAALLQEAHLLHADPPRRRSPRLLHCHAAREPAPVTGVASRGVCPHRVAPDLR